MRLLLMHSPTAGGGAVDLPALCSTLGRAGHEVHAQSTKEGGWKQALERAADLVVIAGGDGTVSKVFRALVGHRLRATVLPSGTANNIARTVGFPADDLGGVATAWGRVEPRRFDLGEVEAPWGKARFVEALGGGAFARLLARAEQAEEPSGPAKLDFALHLMRDELGNAPAEDWSVDLDGTAHDGTYVALQAMNTREIGPNVPLAPDADVEDRRLDVVFIGERERELLCDYLDRRLAQRPARPPALPVRRAETVRLRAPEGAPLHVDDEPWPADGSKHAGIVTARAGPVHLHILAPLAA